MKRKDGSTEMENRSPTSRRAKTPRRPHNANEGRSENEGPPQRTTRTVRRAYPIHATHEGSRRPQNQFDSGTLHVGAAYAVWVGIGAVGAVVVGAVAFAESLTPTQVLFLSLLLVSVLGLKLSHP